MAVNDLVPAADIRVVPNLDWYLLTFLGDEFLERLERVKENRPGNFGRAIRL